MNAVWMPVRQVAAIVFPWGGSTQETPAAERLRWLLHLALWSAILVVLWQLNRWCGLDRMLRSPWPMLHRVWLPLLAALLYPLGWLGLGLWTATRRPPVAIACPDVESAWTDARHALEQAGIDLAATPAFLILGPLGPDLRTLLESLGAAALPQRPAAPFKVFAHAESIYCAVQESVGPDQAPLQDLCRLLENERAPRHPLQGIIVAVPFAAAQAAAPARDFVASCRDRLHAVRQATGLELPIYFVVNGIDGAPPGAEAWFQRFPPHPDLDPAEIAAMYRLGLDWLCLERIPQEVRARIELKPAALSENIRLYQWQSALANWRTRFEKMLSEATQTDDAEPGMVAGCYVAPAAQAARLATIFQADLLKNQACPCWTAATMQVDDAQRRRVWLGYSLGLLALLGCVGGGLAWMAWRSQA